MFEKLLGPPLELETLEERIVYYGLSLTWVWYGLGGIYLAGPAIAWSLMGIWGWRWLSCEEELPNRPLPPLAYIWWLGMLVMWVALVVGHLNWDLGIPLIIKSTIGWAKGWALFAVFVMIGGVLHIRPAVVYRAAMVMMLHTLALIPILFIAPFIGLPSMLFTSPLMILGGPGPEYFEVQFYSRDFAEGVRWRFFTPWAPAAAVAYGLLVPLALRQGPNLARSLAFATALMVVMMCKSRLGMIAIPVALLAAWGLSRLTRPSSLLIAGAAVMLISLAAETAIELLTEQQERMRAMRADSSFVREALARIALYRWQTEAPVWGHGVVEPGPHLVEFMPIGSHHSWYGLLFVKGAVGFGALLVPLLFTWAEMLVKAQRERTARTGLAVIGMFSFTTFTENVEMLAYLMWPAFLIIGIAARRRLVSPFRFPLGSRTTRGGPPEAPVRPPEIKAAA